MGYDMEMESYHEDKDTREKELEKHTSKQSIFRFR